MRSEGKPLSVEQFFSTFGKAKGEHRSIDQIGSSASEGAVWPYMAVPPLKSGQADFNLPAITVGMQVHLLAFERAPQPLHQDVAVAVLPA